MPQSCHFCGALTKRKGRKFCSLSCYHTSVAVRSCSVESCTNLAQPGRKGFCGRHYSRWYRWGDPLEQHRATSTPGAGGSARRAHVEKYKMDRGCADCGYKAHPAALDFDHLPGTTKVRDIKSGQQLGWAALLLEIEKCEVVCANCHRIRTVARRAEEVMPR